MTDILYHKYNIHYSAVVKKLSDELGKSLKAEKGKGEIFYIRCDMRNEEEIKASTDQIQLLFEKDFMPHKTNQQAVIEKVHSFDIVLVDINANKSYYAPSPSKDR